jgi:PhzF family phenazine biosynthesis protein
MGQSIVVVDAFTKRRFQGNPAAVCVLAAPAEEEWMRLVARELNLSETAFLHPEHRGWRLRWFTPAVEVDLCGHATLAAAHVLWESGRLAAGKPARFHTRSGTLGARQEGAGIVLDFPAQPPSPAPAPPELLAALGVPVRWSGRNRADWLLELDDEAAVRSLSPDLQAIGRLAARGVIVTAPADQAGRAGGADFVSRFFGPAVGVPEDPVTGSAHCCLGPFWAARLGRAELTGHQASGRGGTVGVRVRGERVELIGEAVTVWRGKLAD